MAWKIGDRRPRCEYLFEIHFQISLWIVYFISIFVYTNFINVRNFCRSPKSITGWTLTIRLINKFFYVMNTFGILMKSTHPRCCLMTINLAVPLVFLRWNLRIVGYRKLVINLRLRISRTFCREVIRFGLPNAIWRMQFLFLALTIFLILKISNAFGNK